jgi:Uma2 family endonuclease
MSTTSQIVTADELLSMPSNGYRYELVAGELRKMTPTGSMHGYVTGEIAARLGEHVHDNRLGRLFAAETGFRLASDPDTVLAPDASFIRQERIAVIGIPDEFFPEAPALVVEVVSPYDTAQEVDEKMRLWLGAGVELGWVVYPRRRTVTIYRSLSDIRVLTESEMLDGGTVVPGFNCRVGDLFPPADARRKT